MISLARVTAAARVAGLSLASMLIALPAAPQTSDFSIGLEGRVDDERGEPLVGAIVSVFGDNLADGAVTAITDENGRFRVEAVPAGSYRMRAFLAGFLPSAFTKVIVREGVEHVGAVLMSLASLDTSEVSKADDGEPADRSVSELAWLLGHADRNILREKDEEFALPEPSLAMAEVAMDGYVPDFALRGEFGVRAASYDQGLEEFPGAGAGLDGRLAYARLFIPTKADSHWMVSAQVLETALASWAGRAEYVKSGIPGHQLTAGVTYGNYLYGDLQEFRPPEAALSFRQTGQRSTEWFGSAYASDTFQIGQATIEGRVAYEHFGFLQKAGYASPSVTFSRPISDDARTVLTGGAGYRVLAPGGEDIDLLSQVAAAEVYGPSPARRSPLRAERTARMHLGVERLVTESTQIAFNLFQEDATDQLVKAYTKDPTALTNAGYFQVTNHGRFRTRGVGVSVSQSFGAMEGTVGYRFGRSTSHAPHQLKGAPAIAGDDDNIHDVTTVVGTSIDRTMTRVQAAYRLISHPGFHPAVPGFTPGQTVDSRFNFQVFQVLPFVGWNGTSWELMVAVRNLFYEDFEGVSMLDEIAVIDAPRRVLGGVTVRF